MAVYNVGLLKAEMGTFNPVDGTGSDFVELQVYKDTLKVTSTEATVTKHFQAGVNTPRVVSYSGGEFSAAFSVMDTAAKSLAQLLDGTVSSVQNQDTFNPSKGNIKQAIKYLRFTNLNGTVIHIPAASVSATVNFDAAETALYQLNVKVEPTDTGLEAVPNWKLVDPPAEA